MTENTSIMEKQYKYNTLTGRWQRVLINNDIQTISGRVGGAGADINIATGTAPTNQNLYPYMISLNSPGAITFAITNGNSTIGYEILSAAGNRTITTDIDSPICKVATGDALTVTALSAVANSTYTASISCGRVPIDSKIEP